MNRLSECLRIALVVSCSMVLFAGCAATPAEVAYEPSIDGELSVTIEESADAIADALGRCGAGYHAISYRDVEAGDSAFVCTASCSHPTTYRPVSVPYSKIGHAVLTRSNSVFWVDTGGVTYSLSYYDVWLGTINDVRALDFSWTSIEPARRFADALFLRKRAASGAGLFTYIDRGRMLLNQGKSEEALKYARKALEYYPRLGLAFTEENAMDVLDLTKRRNVAAEAIASAEQAEAGGDAATAFDMYCKAYSWTPDAAVGEKTRADIMRIYPKLTTPPELPENARRDFVQAEWHVKKEAYELSLESFNRVALCCPWHAQSYYNRGLIFGQLKRYSEAIKEIKQYLALAPNAANARAVQDRIYMWEAELAKNK